MHRGKPGSEGGDGGRRGGGQAGGYQPRGAGGYGGGQGGGYARGAGGAHRGGNTGGDGGYHRGGRPRAGDFQQGGQGGSRYQQGGGGSRGIQMDVTTSRNLLPVQPTSEMLSGQFGWLGKNIAPTDLQIPPCKGPGNVNHHTISLIVNHVPVKIVLPQFIYQYDIDIDLSEEGKRARKERRQKQDKEGTAVGQAGRGGRGRGGGVRRGRQPSAAGQGGDVGDGKVPPGKTLWKKIVKHVLPLLEHNHQSLAKNPIKIATDGQKQLFTVKKLQLQQYSFEITICDLGDPSETSSDVYFVTIQLAENGVIDTTANDFQLYMENIAKWFSTMHKPLPELATRVDQIYNIVLKTTPMYRFTPVGRAAFFPPPAGDGTELGGGLVNWSGHSLIMNFGWAPFVNIDISNSAFIIGLSVYEVLNQVFQDGGGNYHQQRQGPSPNDRTGWTDGHFDKANELLKNCKVSYSWPTGEKFTRRVTEVFRDYAENHEFSQEGRTMNVLQYCELKGKPVQNPNGICLKMGNAIVPAEFCKVEKGQHFGHKLTEAQTRKMIHETAKPPAIRLENTKAALHLNNFGQDPVLAEFGVRVADQLVTLSNARVLPRPTLIYGSTQAGEQKHVVPGPDGVWTSFESDLKFISPKTEGNPIQWGVIEVSKQYYALCEPELRKFIDTFITTATKVGLNLGTTDNVLRENNGPIDPGRGFQDNLHRDLQYYKQNGYQFVLVIIPRKLDQSYPIIKQCSELYVEGGILTQCVVQKNVKEPRPDATQNIILKLNAKLGGINYLMNVGNGYQNIDILSVPVMIVGADVTHPTVGSPLPSLAAVTASIDRSGMPFMMHTQAQRKAKAGAAEIIEGMEQIMFNMLREFIRRTGYLPRKILYYRDGVGSSQFAEVLQTEMMPMRAACARIQGDPTILALAINDVKLDGPFEPKITFLAVQKRHKTRFFPANPNDGVGGGRNAPPGTIVDNRIVNASNIDFYLLSHTGIQGTSRPTRYQVLWDDNKFTTNELQVLTYYLCYMFCRCNRSVSYPAPTYYAHLAATRAKIHTTGLGAEQLENIQLVNDSIRRQPGLTSDTPMHFV